MDQFTCNVKLGGLQAPTTTHGSHIASLKPASFPSSTWNLKRTVHGQQCGPDCLGGGACEERRRGRTSGYSNARPTQAWGGAGGEDRGELGACGPRVGQGGGKRRHAGATTVRARDHHRACGDTEGGEKWVAVE